MNKNTYPFELIQNTSTQVILKNTAKTSLDVAMNPYVSADIDYITVTKGNNHNCTVIKSDGNTFNFYWGTRGYNPVSENVEMLKRAVTNFISSQGIALDVCTTMQPNKATIYFNDNFNKWQASLSFPNTEKKQNYWSETSTNQYDMLEEIKDIFNNTFSELNHDIAQTGIDVWKCSADRVLCIDTDYINENNSRNEIEDDYEREDY